MTSKKSHQAYYLTFYGFMQFETIKRNPFLPYGDQRSRSISSNAKNTHRVWLTGFFEDGSDGSTFFGSGLSGLGLTPVIYDKADLHMGEELMSH